MSAGRSRATLTRVKAFALRNAKAITALVAALVAYVALRHGLHLSDDLTASIASLVVAAMTWGVPNTPTPPGGPS